MIALYKKLALFSIVVAAGIAVLQSAFPGVVLPYTWYLFGYFVALTWVSLAIIGQNLDDAADFSNMTMASTGIRLFVSTAVLFAYYWNVKEREPRMHFTFTFFGLYFLFSGFEIQTLLANLRRNLRKPGENNGKNPD